ncbi:hypothetical protein [Anaeromyxobacter oryzisoli]|uniref:hypothetical protein n=1 Tax=Anaeromyxobacter oryzisoli TaxID=2925408 RepID=UPI001F589CF3|nr:hypothetical protein [Anaeromyxobacter sp. SG63]
MTLERVDASSECDGLVPDQAPAPVAIAVAPPDGHACAGGLSDGTGSVAVEATGSGASSFQAFGADGSPAQTFEAAPPLVADLRGWHAVRAEPAGEVATTLQHLSIAPDGAVARADQIFSSSGGSQNPRWALAADPRGGSLAAVVSVSSTGNHFAGVDTHRFDASGAPSAAVSVLGSETEPILVLGAVTRGGEAFVAWPLAGSLFVRWVGADGVVHEIGADDLRLLGQSPSGVLAAAPLLDGGIAVGRGGHWARRFAPRAQASEPAPAWLSARDGWTFRFTRANEGYALLPPAGQGSGDCSQTIDLLAPSGRLCGHVVLHRGEGDGAPCTTGIVDQGWDGTVVQQTTADACTYRSWPRLLAKP